jgi:hypothetical protein
MTGTRFQVYGWYRDLACTEPFYIGKGLKNRETHWRDLRRNKNMRLIAVVAKVVTQYGVVPTKILYSGLTHEQAIEIEMRLIEEIGRRPNGPLMNITRGGVGGPFTPEQAAAHSQKMKGRKVVNKGVSMSDEQRAKLVEAWARRREFRLAILEQINIGKRGKPAHNKGKPASEEHRAKLRDAWAKNPTARHTEESNARRSESAKRTYQDPELRARIGAAVKEALSDPQWRAEQSARVTEIWKRRKRLLVDKDEH